MRSLQTRALSATRTLKMATMLPKIWGMFLFYTAMLLRWSRFQVDDVGY